MIFHNWKVSLACVLCLFIMKQTEGAEDCLGRRVLVMLARDGLKSVWSCMRCNNFTLFCQRFNMKLANCLATFLYPTSTPITIENQRKLVQDIARLVKYAKLAALSYGFAYIQWKRNSDSFQREIPFRVSGLGGRTYLHFIGKEFEFRLGLAIENREDLCRLRADGLVVSYDGGWSTSLT